MKALALLVLGIALVDGLNPSTIAPALVLAVGKRGAPLVALFTLGVFVPSFVAGVIVIAGPGQALLDLIPHIGPNAEHWLEIGAAVVLAVLAVVLWIHRGRVTKTMTRPPPGGLLGAAGLGGGIMLAELPTAVPYFAALAAIIGSGESFSHQLELVTLFNVAFILPLLGILAVRILAGAGSARLLEQTRQVLDRYVGVALPCIVGLLAIVLLILGVVGLVSG